MNGDGCTTRARNTSSIYFEHIEGESMVIVLDLKGLAVPPAQPAVGAIEPSHALTAIGLPAGRTRASVRFSLGKQNMTEDIDRTCAGTGDGSALARVVTGVSKASGQLLACTIRRRSP